MPTLKRISNILRYGIGPGARKRKHADKQRVRDSRFESELWQRGEGLAKRQYDSYDDYVSHQSAKLGKIEHRLRETEREDLVEFQRRFASCSALEETRSVVCLGARLGTEVQALHALGYFAVGIDLNPGEGNCYVLPGDFHDLVFPDGSLDAVYTNALDHVFDLDKVLAEISRVLRPGGLFIGDVLPGYDEGFVPGAYEATHWPTLESFLQRIAESSGFTREALTDLGLHRRDHWFQAVFRKGS